MYNRASIYKGCGVYSLGDGESTKLAAKTLRFLFSKSDYDPTVAGVGSSGTWQKVDTAAANVWDWTVSGGSITDSFNSSFTSSDNYVEVIAAGDTSGISAMARVFRNCTSLKKVCLFNTSAATSLRACFSGCSSLKEVPNFDFSSATSLYETFRDCSSLEKIPPFSTTVATDVTSMFNGCVKVKEGALDLYTQMSTQTTPPTTTTNCFKDCGKDTETGAAELAQIPADWGGTAPATLNMGAPQNLTEPLSPSVIDGDDSLTN